jgi:NADH-quinone oxidoreductase subunit A
VATVFRRWVASGSGLFAFLELALFLGIIALGLAYVWAKGDLAWIKEIKAAEVRGVTPLRRAPAPEPTPPAEPTPSPAADATASGNA